jgi:hypothetical protein
MDAPSSIEFSWLQQPKIVATEMTEGHCVPKKILFEIALILVLCFLFFFDVLFDESSLIVIEVLENKLFIQGIFLFVILLLV